MGGGDGGEGGLLIEAEVVERHSVWSESSHGTAAGVIEGEVGVDEDGDGAHPPTPWSRAALLQASALLTRCRPAAQSTRARVGGVVAVMWVAVGRQWEYKACMARC